MNIVFLIHYFPPLNSTGSRRVQAFAKYLNRAGHKVFVISTVKTAKDGLLSEQIPDYCNLIEVSWFKKTQTSNIQTSKIITTKANRTKLGNILVKFKRWVMKFCGQLLDHRLFFAAFFLKPNLPDAIRTTLQEADVLISSCPPWPTHLAGLICSRRFKKKWIADYRDQFSGNHIFLGNRFTRYLEKFIDKKLLKHADAVTTISLPMNDYYYSYNQNVHCIENGYDNEQFASIKKNILQDNSSGEKIYLRHMGTITCDRIPSAFFASLLKIEDEQRKKIIIEFYGESSLIKDFLQKNYPKLLENVVFFGTVSHQESIQRMYTADALLLKETSSTTSASAQGVLTTKLFEYLAVQKPIIAEIDPSTLIGQTITQSGLCVACTTNKEEMYQSLQQLLSKEKIIKPNLEYISQFSRKIKTDAFEKIIVETVGRD